MPNRFSKHIARTIVSAAVLFVVGCGGAEAGLPGGSPETIEPTQNVPRSTITEDEALIWLQAPSGNYQTGWARIWEERGSLFVEVDVVPSEAVAQPAHIHSGACASLGIIDYRLENIIGGHSLTEFPDMTLADVADGTLSINLHLSFADFSTFTACGEIPVLASPVQSNSNEPTEPTESTEPAEPTEPTESSAYGSGYDF